jgi:DNA-binding XRE family transcriptional regulator
MRREHWKVTIPFKTLKQKWMMDPEFVAEYERIGPEMELAMSLAEARRDAELTQVELAKRMKTTQAEVARIESGRAGPKWGTIERYALALGKWCAWKRSACKSRGA